VIVLLNWKRRKGEKLEIPCLICWEIWKHRNLAIFEDRPLNRDIVCTSILQVLGETRIGHVTKDKRIDRPPLLLWDLGCGFF
jgi:hypothetical protein